MKLRDRALVGFLSVALIALSIAALAVPPVVGRVSDSRRGPATASGVLRRASNASPFG
jgi:hypothetical protein